MQQAYDAVIVGAGPAGLGAARTLARLGFQTLVLERAGHPGGLGHACEAIIVPSPDQIGSQANSVGLYFPQIDLLVPESLVLTRRVRQQCLAPNGEPFPTVLGEAAGLAALIDQPGLLRLLTRQADNAGAEFRWGTPALRLLFKGDRVTGVQTTAGDVRAKVVLSAEGAGGHLCAEAGLFATYIPANRQLLVMHQELVAPKVTPDHLGRIVTLGRSHTDALSGYGTLLMPAPGRATMFFTSLLAGAGRTTMAAGWQYLAGYATDLRIAGFLGGARVLKRSSFVLPISDAPERAVRSGFMGIGDALAPAGYLGILPAMHLGRQAALVAAEAMDDGDTKQASLQPFDDSFRATLLPGLITEARALMEILVMHDDELNRLCRVLNALHLGMPFLHSTPPITGSTLAWLGSQIAVDSADLGLVARIYGSSSSASWSSFEVPAAGYQHALALS